MMIPSNVAAKLLWLSATCCCATLGALPNVALAQDVAAGKKVFAQCAACHTLDGSPSVGPSLKGVVGRPVGSLPGFRFSRALKTSGKTWNEALLSAFISNPQAAMPGSVMPFSGLADATEVANLVAFLKTQK